VRIRLEGYFYKNKKGISVNRPVIGLEAIHRRYFVSEDGEELISLRTFKGMSAEMQESGAVIKFETMINGRKKVRIVALEPIFSIWMLKKWGKKNKHE